MNFTKKIENKLLIRKLKNIPIKDLIKLSDFIQSKCINGINKFKNINVMYWYHALPLKDKQGSHYDYENWDLENYEIKEINKILRKLNDYADLVIRIFYSNKNLLLKESLNDITNFLPPWIVFPLYDANTIAWRMGDGEAYMEIYIGFINSLTDEEFEKYNETYKQPCYMEGANFEINKINYILRNN